MASGVMLRSAVQVNVRSLGPWVLSGCCDQDDPDVHSSTTSGNGNKQWERERERQRGGERGRPGGRTHPLLLTVLIELRDGGGARLDGGTDW